MLQHRSSCGNFTTLWHTYAVKWFSFNCFSSLSRPFNCIWQQQQQNQNSINPLCTHNQCVRICWSKIVLHTYSMSMWVWTLNDFRILSQFWLYDIVELWFVHTRNELYKSIIANGISVIESGKHLLHTHTPANETQLTQREREKEQSYIHLYAYVYTQYTPASTYCKSIFN